MSIEQDLLAKSNFERWMITLSVMLVAVIEVLDMTIVNVALRPMMGALGANQDQITWVLTSYIVSSAIVMLLTGYLVNRFGQKKLLVFSIVGFLLSSMFCGISTSLVEMVLFRTLQGIFGASLVPLSQTILRATYPKEDFGKAMAIWGIGIMVAPVMGPTLGGFITEHLDWRWVFYINLPVCIIAFFMALKFIKETPKVVQSIDWLSVVLMALGVGALQIFLDQGNSHDWFQSHEIVFLAITSVVCLTWFVWRGLRIDNNIINLRLLANRDFCASFVMVIGFCVAILGVISIQPLLFENLLGYPTELTGIVMAPRGIASAIAMIMANVLMKKIDPRLIMIGGLLSACVGSYMMVHYNLQTPEFYWMYSGAFQGFGLGLFFVPLTTLSFNTLKPEQIPEASGMFSFGRNLGISIGISILSTVLTRQTQVNWMRLGGHLNPFNEHFRNWLSSHGWTLHDPIAIHTLGNILSQQAGMIAFINVFWMVAIILVLIIPGVFLFSKPDPTKEMVMGH